MVEKAESMLSPYRVLDLTDEKGFICGKILGDLGADVIKIERPGGDPSRSIGPFYHDEADPEKSLFWFAFNTNKRGITLNIETADGQEIFKRLVKSADFVIESFPLGYMEKLGLGYSALEKINPRGIAVSITPFGQTGPYKDYKAPDIVAWAMGGEMYQRGDADRPPVRISHHFQSYLNAGAEAAAGALMALYSREATGEGQHVVVSIQASVAHFATIYVWDMLRVSYPRGERVTLGTQLRLRGIWPCKDGEVYFRLSSGVASPRNNPPLVEWMDSEGMADDYLRKFNWDTFGHRRTAQDVVDQLEERIARFFMTHTKRELFEGGIKYRLMIYPISTVGDILEYSQLAARRYWAQLEHPELGTTITYPGAFVNASQAPPRVLQRAPLIGEHNEEILGKELGLSKEELLILKQARVI